ncbi:hypothetical protein ACIODS_11220 [Micromonospora chalcea]|uniref:hypothetical protein n=1 Tax=Micromonospora chalcea TaxID=1874 RepID=UPI00380652DD
MPTAHGATWSRCGRRPALTSGEPAAEALEGEAERPLDVVRLQPAGPGLLHEPLHLGQIGVRHGIVGEGAFLQEFLETVGDGGIDDLFHLGPSLGQVAVPDGLDQQLAQRCLFEGSAQDVENLAAVSLTLLLDLLQQPGEDLALSWPGAPGRWGSW